MKFIEEKPTSHLPLAALSEISAMSWPFNFTFFISNGIRDDGDDKLEKKKHTMDFLILCGVSFPLPSSSISPKKKINGLLPLWPEIGVGRLILFYIYNLDREEMPYHSCVCILWHAEPQNWFNWRGLYSIISGSTAFLGQLLYILTFL